MPMSPNNLDNEQPRNTYCNGVPLANKYLEDGTVPIFWGDNQILSDETETYSRPSGMKDAPLHIPKVVRFLYTYDEGDGDLDDEHKDDSDSGPPEIEYTYRYTLWWGLQATLKAAYRNPDPLYHSYPYAMIDGLYDAYQSFENHYGPVEPSWGDTAFSASYIYGNVHVNGDYSTPPGSNPGRVEVRVSYGTPLYDGPITGATTWFEFPVYRSITWFRKRVDNGFETFIAGFTTLSPPGTDGAQPPRKTYTEYETGLTKSEYPPDPPYHGVP